MAKKDRTLTVDEVLAGHISSEYLDLKEQLVRTNRRIYKLSSDRDFLNDKIDMVGPREDLLEEWNRLDHSIKSLKEKAINIKRQMEAN